MATDLNPIAEGAQRSIGILPAVQAATLRLEENRRAATTWQRYHEEVSGCYD